MNKCTPTSKTTCNSKQEDMFKLDTSPWINYPLKQILRTVKFHQLPDIHHSNITIHHRIELHHNKNFPARPRYQATSDTKSTSGNHQNIEKKTYISISFDSTASFRFHRLVNFEFSSKRCESPSGNTTETYNTPPLSIVITSSASRTVSVVILRQEVNDLEFSHDVRGMYDQVWFSRVVTENRSH